MKNLTWTIVKKEFSRFFGDASLVISTIILPGVLIYILYSLMGYGMAKMENEMPTEPTTVRVSNMPYSMEPIFSALPVQLQRSNSDTTEFMAELSDKEYNMIYINFPADFDSITQAYDPLNGQPAPNIEIFYNSANNGSAASFESINKALDVYEASQTNMYDINRVDDPENPTVYDRASISDTIGKLFAGLMPMLLIMMIFSGCMAIAPTAIAGEKERGTLATLLVTPMKRSQLALGKIISLSVIALLSGISSFIGIVLSLPKMMNMKSESISLDSPIYTTNDILLLLLIILTTTLILISAVSIISAYAKDVKSAGTMVSPLMLIIIIISLFPMMETETATNLAVYFIPFYNNIECMAGIFGHSITTGAVWVTIISNIVYTCLSVFALTKMFNSEKVMFGK